MTIDERDYMNERREARLREAMLRLEPWATRKRPQQLPLFASRWDRFKLRAVRALRSEWFNMALFLALVLVAVIWSASVAS